jgi:hypothetical protein
MAANAPAVPAMLNEAEAAPPAALPKRAAHGKRSSARPVQTQLNDQYRQVLERWAAREDGVGDDAQAEDEWAGTPPPKRAPKPSTFLNSERPAKRNRKKNQTRDWLC